MNDIASQQSQILTLDTYKNEKIFAKSALNALFDQHGLTDFQNYMIRHEIENKHLQLGLQELNQHEYSRMFFTGFMRTITSYRNFFKLWYFSMRKSNNWSIELSRWSKLEPWDMIITSWNSYFHVNQLWKDGQYQEAGEAMVYDIFPEKLPQADSSIVWWYLPNLVWWDGQEIGEEISGLIYRFLGEENHDNLSSCVEY